MIPWQIEYIDGVPTVHIELRSTGLWLVQRYLLKLGGEVIEEEKRIQGPGWEATMTRAEPLEMGSLRIGRAYLDIRGQEAALRELMASLGVWLMRGGG